MDAFNRRDRDAAVACFAPDAVFYPVVAEALGRQEPFRGVEGLEAYFALTGELWEELRVEVAEIQQAGDAVVAIGTVRGRGRGGSIEEPVLWTWTVRDGLIVEGRVHGDTEPARAALGLAPARGSARRQ
jgi:ketosteroid isomerase-like protein